MDKKSANEYTTNNTTDKLFQQRFKLIFLNYSYITSFNYTLFCNTDIIINISVIFNVTF